MIEELSFLKYSLSMMIRGGTSRAARMRLESMSRIISSVIATTSWDSMPTP